MLTAWFLNGVAVKRQNERALSQVGTVPDMTLHVARMKNNKHTETTLEGLSSTNNHILYISLEYTHTFYVMLKLLLSPGGATQN